MDNHSATITNYLQKFNEIYDFELIFNEIISTYNIQNTSEKYMIKSILNKSIEKKNKIKTFKNIVSDLQKLKLPEQRSPEWYELRKGLLTASSLASALGHDHFKSREQLIYEKTSIEEVPYVSNPITEWGVKYEEIATKFYEHLNNVKIIEFGLLILIWIHVEYSFNN